MQGAIQALIDRQQAEDIGRPVITDDEMSLYFRLYSECTKNSKTDWPQVVRLWNLEVAASLREQEAGRPAAQLGLKNAEQLQQFEKSFVMEMAKREAVMLHDVSHLLPTTPIASSLEQAVDNLATRLMEGQRRQQEEQQEAAAVLAGMNQQSGSSGSGLQKGSGRDGAGAQHGCRPCRDKGIQAQLTKEHKATCKHWAKQFRQLSDAARLKMTPPMQPWTDAELA
jgi:hypothetical protein